MPTREIVPADDRYTITELGRYDLIFAPTCLCDPRLKGLIVQCAACGTVYGHLSELDQRPKRIRRQHR